MHNDPMVIAFADKANSNAVEQGVREIFTETILKVDFKLNNVLSRRRTELKCKRRSITFPTSENILSSEICIYQ